MSSRLLNITILCFLLGGLESTRSPEREIASLGQRPTLEEVIEESSATGLLLISEDPGPPKTLCGTKEFILEHGCARIAASGCGAEYSYIEGSCWKGWSEEIFGNSEPKLALYDEIVNKHGGVDKVAEDLVFRHYRLKEKDQIDARSFEDPAYSLYRGIEPQIMFHDSNLESIAASGFLNQHQTRTSRGILADSRRWTAEEEYLNVFFIKTELMKSLAPKYMYGVPTESIINHSSSSSYNTRYGNVIAVFSTRLKNRLTLTAGDSLDRFYIESKREMRSLKWLNSAKDFVITREYLEAQVWGSLRLEDAEYILVNCVRPDLSKGRISQIYEASGVPVYSCRRITEHNAARYVKDKLLKGEAPLTEASQKN